MALLKAKPIGISALCVLAALAISAGAFATTTMTSVSDDTAPQGGPPPMGQDDQGGPPSGKNSALDAALKECFSSAGKDASGKPDRQAMETCMKAKGFDLPKGPPPGQGRPHGGGQGGPPDGTQDGSSSQ